MATKICTSVERPQKTEARVKIARASKNSPGAEAIGDPAAGRNQDRKGNQIGADADIQFDRGDAKIPRHIGQGGGDHRPVEKLHKKAPATSSAGAEKARSSREEIAVFMLSLPSRV